MTCDPHSAVASTPCVRLCRLDPGSGLCRGCGRSLDEIGRWGGLDEPARHRIMAALPDRLAAMADDPSLERTSS